MCGLGIGEDEKNVGAFHGALGLLLLAGLYGTTCGVLRAGV